MKESLLVVLICCLALTGPHPGAADITGSVHDFTPSGVDIPVEGGTGRICVVCHTPHNAIDVENVHPLWNHTLTTAEYDLYSSDSQDSTSGAPDGSTVLCLSCHDDTVALDAWNGNPNPLNLHMTGHRIILGTDLRNDHPVSIDYNTSLVSNDGELHSPDDASGLGGSIAENLLDHNGKLQCTSCHDVHNRMNNGNYLGARYGLLWIRNQNSVLCLTCHIK